MDRKNFGVKKIIMGILSGFLMNLLGCAPGQSPTVEEFVGEWKSEFNSYDEDGNYAGQWRYKSNPIIGYDWSKPYNDAGNELALKKNIYSKSKDDYLTFGGNYFIYGIWQILVGYGPK